MAKITVSESAVVAAPPDQVFLKARDFARFKEWAPWFVAEPDCPTSHSSDGFGWNGRYVGEGSIRVLEESRPGSMEWNVDFVRPHKTSARSVLEFRPDPEGSRVTWTMHASLPFFLFWMKDTLKAMIGMDYRRGLLRLKDWCEKGRILSRQEYLGVIDQERLHWAGIRSQATFRTVGDRIKEAFCRISEWKESDGEAAFQDRAACLYHKWDMAGEKVDFTAAMLVDRAPGTLPRGMASGDVPAGPVYAVRHTGSYRHVGDAWAGGMARGREKAFKQDMKAAAFEIYENDPRETPEEELSTLVCLPVAR